MISSLGAKVYAGINMDASFNALSISFGDTGSSAETPSITLKSPSLVKKSVANFGR